MPTLTSDEQVALGLTPPAPKEQEIDPKTKITRLATLKHGIYRRRLNLSEADKKKVVDLLDQCYREWNNNTSLLRSKLLKYNNRLEGISSPKTDPWPGACSLMVPLIEIHALGLHSLVTSTILDNDPIWMVKEEIPPSVGGEEVDPNVEWFLNFVSKIQLRINESLSEAYYNAMVTPLSIGVLDWVEEIGKQYRVDAYDTIEEFQAEFDSPEKAGISEAQYTSYIAALAAGEQVQIKIEENVVKYRGPKLRIVELKDFVRAPVDAPNLEYTVFHGEQFKQRANWFRVGAKNKWLDKDEVELMLKQPGETTPIDNISQQQNRNEGISSTPIRTSDEYYPIRGNLRIDLDNDGEEELYHVLYNPKTKHLLRIEDYPYWHNRINHIPFRIRKKTNRLQGRCLTDMLWDLNEECDTQHHLRIDSRAISTVPSFKKLLSETSIDFSRKDQHFYPGVVFVVNKSDGMTQLEIKQTDMGQSQQEEQTLFQLAEWLVGNSPSLRAGTPQTKDPRASGKKAQAQIQQSNIRVDDYIKELLPATNEVGSQILELFYQFAPNMVIPFAKYNPETEKWIRNEIQRTKLRSKNMHVAVARTTVMDNKDAMQQRALVRWQIWNQEPMIGGVPKRRHELIKRTLRDTGEKDITTLLPSLEQIQQEQLEAQQQAAQHLGAAALHGNIQQKVGEQPDQKEQAEGKRQGGPDVSVGSLGKKG
jgi:hypothetical protein